MLFLNALILSVLMATISTASIPQDNIAAEQTLQGRSTETSTQSIGKRATLQDPCVYNPRTGGHCQ
ncbi:hypothetical protein DFH28DRAFT_1217062 [Melampsora americana]|nr:hypothetical protein DFH28DRAFT_1217062 [Melampsora americana]